MSYGMLEKFIRVVKVFLGLAMTGTIMSSVIMLASSPQILSAQTPDMILTGAVALSDKMPQDVIKLAMVSAIVANLVLVACVSLGLRSISVLVNRFLVALNAFADRPCLLENERGKSIMRDKLRQAMILAQQDVKERNKG